MIEISHEQARRLLRGSQDRKLPEGQWNTLQAHLENCAECRKYQDQLNNLDKNIQRALHTALDIIPHPAGEIPAHVLKTRSRQMHHRHRLTVYGIATGALLIIFLFVRGYLAGQESSSPGASTPETAVNLSTPVPTARPGDFQAVIAYDAVPPGKPGSGREIYLLNPGTQPENITNNAADDSDPAWSPDGEWIAFLSDRGGKSEVYVTGMTRNQVIQLTKAPDIIWQGPLSWSSDGKYIALAGVRKSQGGQRWVYLVSLNGSGASALAGTRGGEDPKFSPTGDRLAYRFSDADQSGVAIIHLDTGDKVSRKWPGEGTAPLSAFGSSFDWSPDGSYLVFTSPATQEVAANSAPEPESVVPKGTSASQIVAVGSLNTNLTLFNNPTEAVQLATSSWASAFPAVSWAPDRTPAYLEDLGDARANDKPGQTTGGCMTIQLLLNGFNSTPYSYNGVCVEGGLDRSSWYLQRQPFGSWVVVLGHQPGESQRSIFAIRLPNTFSQRGNQQGGSGEMNFKSTAVRLADGTGVGPLVRVRPRLPRNGSAIMIDPQPVVDNETVLPPADFSQRPGGPAGQIVYVMPNHSMSVLVTANPDGTGGRVLASSTNQARCPRWSPDGQQIALVMQDAPPGDAFIPKTGSKSPPDMSTTAPDPNEEVFVINADGSDLRAVSHSETLTGSGLHPGPAQYGCPVWSPAGASGGPYLAVTIQTTGQWYLGILPVAPGNTAPSRFLLIGQPEPNAPVVWAANGRSLFLANTDRDGRITVVRINVPEDPTAGLSAEDLVSSNRWNELDGLAITANNQVVAIGQSQLNRGMILAQVYPTGTFMRGQLISFGRNSSDYSTRWQAGSMARLSDTRLGIILKGPVDSRYKAALYLFDIPSRQLTMLTMVQDTVLSAAWSPDGQWLIYSTESGLWGLDLQKTLDKEKDPVWLSPVPIESLDWR